MPDRAVLVMAYGTPRSLDDVEDYYTHIRHGRPPPADLLEDLKRRYLAIGGTSPLYELTRAQAAGIEARLDVKAYLGMKHSFPFIEDAVAAMAHAGVAQAVGLVLAPHYSKMSIGQYAGRAEAAAAEVGWDGFSGAIKSWHLESGYIDLLEHRVHDAIAVLPAGARADATVIFTAHSLPARIVQGNDPYPDQVAQTAEAVADLAGLTRWRTAWQSAGRTQDAWLGPDVLDVIDEEAARGAAAIVVCPCGFVADHLEVLYDVDIECREKTESLGLAFARTRSPNDDPAFLDTLATIVRRRLDRA